MFDCQIEEVGRLLESTRPVRDHDAGDFGIMREEFIDVVCKRNPIVDSDIGAADVHYLFYFHFCELLDLGNGAHEFLTDD